MHKFSGKEFDERVEFFDRMACSSWLTKIHEELIKETGSWTNKQVLDVGCGTGRLLFRGAGESTRIFGADLSEGMIQRAKELAADREFATEPDFCVADAENIPFPENKFDIVLSTCVVFLLPDPEPALREMHRVLKPDGVLALINPSEKLNSDTAKRVSADLKLPAEEKDALLQWGRISERRLRFNNLSLEEILTEHHFKDINQKLYLEDIALLSFARKK